MWITLIPVTVGAFQHLVHYSAVVGVFLPSHLWYPPSQCGLPHPAPPLTCCSPAELHFRPTRRRLLCLSEEQLPLASPPHLPAPHWLPYFRSRPLGASDSSSRGTIQVKNAGKAASQRAERARHAGLGAGGGRAALDESLKAGSSLRAALPRDHGEGSLGPRAPRGSSVQKSARPVGQASLTPPRLARTRKPPCCPQPRAAGSAERRATSCAGRAGLGAAAAAAAAVARPAAGAGAAGRRGAAPPRAPLPSGAWASGGAGLARPALAQPIPHHHLARPAVPPRPTPHRHLVRRFWNHVLT